jgi:hypothetical protein
MQKYIKPEVLKNGDIKFTDHITGSTIVLNNDLRDYLKSTKK